MNLSRLTLYGLFLLAAAASGDEPAREVGWREDFSNRPPQSDGTPHDWKFDGKKLMVPRTQFRVIDAESADDGKVLEVESKQSTGTIITLPGADLTKYPILRWRWRVRNLAPNADGRTKLDDQVVAVYFGAGGPLSRKSVAYRWETETPIGTTGRCKFGAGIVSVFSVCHRNKTTPLNEWIVEEVDAVALFEEIYGFVPGPDEYVVTIAGNSQYTNSHTFAEVDYIELVSRPETETAKRDPKPKVEIGSTEKKEK